MSLRCIFGIHAWRHILTVEVGFCHDLVYKMCRRCAIWHLDEFSALGWLGDSHGTFKDKNVIDNVFAMAVHFNKEKISEDEFKAWVKEH